MDRSDDSAMLVLERSNPSDRTYSYIHDSFCEDELIHNGVLIFIYKLHCRGCSKSRLAESESDAAVVRISLNCLEAARGVRMVMVWFFPRATGTRIRGFSMVCLVRVDSKYLG